MNNAFDFHSSQVKQHALFAQETMEKLRKQTNEKSSQIKVTSQLLIIKHTISMNI